MWTWARKSFSTRDHWVPYCVDSRTETDYRTYSKDLLDLSGRDSFFQVDRFQSFCRPTIKPILSNFCTELTGIEQVGLRIFWGCTDGSTTLFSSTKSTRLLSLLMCSNRWKRGWMNVSFSHHLTNANALLRPTGRTRLVAVLNDLAGASPFLF